jgi:hypothetical protein
MLIRNLAQVIAQRLRPASLPEFPIEWIVGHVTSSRSQGASGPFAE